MFIYADDNVLKFFKYKGYFKIDPYGIYMTKVEKLTPMQNSTLVHKRLKNYFLDRFDILKLSKVNKSSIRGDELRK